MGDRPIRPGRFWWIAVVRGIFSLVLGTAVLFAQDDRTKLANFIGIYWLLSGLLTFRWALTVRWRRGARIGMAAGCVSVVAAVLVLLRHPLQHAVSAAVLLNLLGVAAVLMGSLRLLGAFEIEKRTGRRWTFGGLALGGVEVFLGVVLFFARTGNVRVIAVALAIWGLVGGSLLLIEGVRLRRLAGASGSIAGMTIPGP